MDPKTLEALQLRADNERLKSKVHVLQSLRLADLKDYEEIVTQLRALRVEFDMYVQTTQR